MTEGWTSQRLLDAVRAGVPSVSVHIDPFDTRAQTLPVHALSGRSGLLRFGYDNRSVALRG